jgi:RNA polymerase sigma-70 factor (ECF subfamily)
MDDMEATATRESIPFSGPMQAGALEDVFRDHHAMVFRAAFRITGNAEDAEDVLQTVFLRLARREDESSDIEHLPGYLRRAAVNAAFDLLRSRQRTRSIPLEDVEPILPDDAVSPERAMHAGEMRDWLRRTVARLSPMAAQAFALRFFEDKENPEIAQILGTSLGAVSVTLSRARDRVEKEYQAYWRKS